MVCFPAGFPACCGGAAAHASRGTDFGSVNSPMTHATGDDEPGVPGRFSDAEPGRHRSNFPPRADLAESVATPDRAPSGEPPSADWPARPDAGDFAAHAPPNEDFTAANGPPEENYWTLSSTPLTSLAFTLPLVAAYEGGVLLLGRGSPRNGADVWLRHLLDALGFGEYFLLPVLTIVGLLAWQFLSHDRWRFSARVLPGMAAECVLWAVVLVGIGRLQQSLWPHGATLSGSVAAAVPLAAGGSLTSVPARLIGFCGAGLYEELLFRLLMLPIAVFGFERLGCSRLAAGGWAILLSSLVFSAAHYVGPLGDTFGIYSFTFRFVAGVFFAALFLVRGFGIAAGSHFFYDLLVGLV